MTTATEKSRLRPLQLRGSQRARPGSRKRVSLCRLAFKNCQSWYEIQSAVSLPLFSRPASSLVDLLISAHLCFHLGESAPPKPIGKHAGQSGRYHPEKRFNGGFRACSLALGVSAPAPPLEMLLRGKLARGFSERDWSCTWECRIWAINPSIEDLQRCKKLVAPISWRLLPSSKPMWADGDKGCSSQRQKLTRGH